jgi:thiamine-phosphate pyrophosphorylase
LIPAPFIYPLIDTGVCQARAIDPVALADACLRGGARLLQLRAKEEPSGEILALADRIVALAGDAKAEVVINDRADLARMAGAAGVHVGQTDMPVVAVRAIVGAGAIVGLSTHDRDQIDRALDTSASYIAVGPVFPTGTKDTGYAPRGLELVRYAAGRGKPVVAIGGVTLDRVEALVDAGASGLAVITDILDPGGSDPERRVRAFVARLGGQPFNV